MYNAPEHTMALLFNIPNSLWRKSDKTALDGSIRKTLETFAWLPSRALELFPDFTDHGPDHLRDVLSVAEKLIAPATWKKFSPEDCAVLITAVLLHDIGMHLTRDGLTQLCLGQTAHRAIAPFDAAPWSDLWQQFRASARQFSDQQNIAIFGITNPGSPPDLLTTDWSEMDRRFAGEFVRRHHARLAHEIALFGFPGPDGSALVLDEGLTPLADIAGLVARSHGMNLRPCLEYLRLEYSNVSQPHRVHAVYLMALLRVSDFLQYHPERAPQLRLRAQSLRSPVSRREWKKHIVNVSDGDDPETYYIFAEPPDVETYLGIRSIISGLQSELDHSWAVLGEVYRSEKFHLTKRRVRSNFDALGWTPKAGYLPRHARFEAKSAEVLHLLVQPFYGGDPSYGVRELTQNAVDAVRELKASGKYEGPKLQKGADVSVIISKDAITVEDCGVGMTADTIINYFLKAGASFRDSIAWQLAFGSESAQPKVLRSGHFGIGALAAFLLGPTIQLSTRHWAESKGLQFEAGISDDPIEVVACEHREIGTTIKIPISTETYEVLKHRYLDFYKFDWPSVNVEIDGYPVTQRGCLCSNFGANQPAWLPLTFGEDLHLEWSRTTGREGSQTYVNGFLVGSDRPTFYVGKAGKDKSDHPIGLTCGASWHDYNNRLPLNLKRTEMSAIIAPDALAHSFARNWIAYALAKKDLINWTVFSRPSPYPCWYAWTDQGLILFEHELIRRVRPRSILVPGHIVGEVNVDIGSWPYNEIKSYTTTERPFIIQPSEVFRTWCGVHHGAGNVEFYPTYPLPRKEQPPITRAWREIIGDRCIPYEQRERRKRCAPAYIALAQEIAYWQVTLGDRNI
jgi:hypothetical protein